jgi:hypothetical protein
MSRNVSEDSLSQMSQTSEADEALRSNDASSHRANADDDLNQAGELATAAIPAPPEASSPSMINLYVSTSESQSRSTGSDLDYSRDALGPGERRQGKLASALSRDESLMIAAAASAEGGDGGVTHHDGHSTPRDSESDQ